MPRGRKPGVPNKYNADVKEMILWALNSVGGGQYLAEQAKSNPQSFMTLVGKVMPMQVAGDPKNPLKFTVTWEK